MVCAHGSVDSVMCACVSVRAYEWVCVCAFYVVHVYTFVCALMCMVCVCVPAHLSVYVVHVCTFVCVHVCTFVCVCVCAHLCVCICVFLCLFCVHVCCVITSACNFDTKARDQNIYSNRISTDNGLPREWCRVSSSMLPLRSLQKEVSIIQEYIISKM